MRMKPKNKKLLCKVTYDLSGTLLQGVMLEMATFKFKFRLNSGLAEVNC